MMGYTYKLKKKINCNFHHVNISESGCSPHI